MGECGEELIWSTMTYLLTSVWYNQINPQNVQLKLIIGKCMKTVHIINWKNQRRRGDSFWCLQN